MTAALAEQLTDPALLASYLRAHHQGRANCLPLAGVAEALGWEERYVQVVAREAREAGLPICSTSGHPAGLWYGDDTEARRTGHSLVRRGVNTLRAGTAMLSAAALPGQEKLLELPPSLLQWLEDLESYPGEGGENLAETAKVDSAAAVLGDGHDCPAAATGAAGEGVPGEPGWRGAQLELLCAAGNRGEPEGEAESDYRAD